MGTSQTAIDLAQRYDIDLVSATTLANYGFEPDIFDQLQARVLGGVKALAEVVDGLTFVDDKLDGSLFDGAPPDGTSSDDSSPDGSSPGKSLGGRLDANRIQSAIVEPLPSKELTELPKVGTAKHTTLATEGMAAISAGEVAVLVLAGGMATRFGGGVKALAEVVDGLTFVDAKLADLRLIASRQTGQAGQSGKPDQPNRINQSSGGGIPMWLMTSFLSDSALREWASAAAPTTRDSAITAPTTADSTSISISLAPQGVSMRLRLDGDLFRTEQGQPSLYTPGHADINQALQHSGLLTDFVANGGRHVYVSNVDNAAATLDPAIIGAHRRAGTPITCEVTAGLEVGGSPWLVDKRPQIVESWRLPLHIDPTSADHVNTNSLVIDVETLATNYPLTWFEVHKEVDGTQVVQFEHLIGELTAFVDTTMLLVERDGENGRFQPVKDANELQQRRQQIELILTARGILS